MALPANVQRQVDEANRLQTEAQDAANTPSALTPPEAPAAEPQPNQPQAQQPSAPAAPAAPAPAQPPQQPSAIDWQARAQKAEHSVRVLQGKYNAEVPELHRRLKELDAKMTELTAKPAAPVAPDPQDAQDIEQFGEEQVRMVKRNAEEAARRVAQEVVGASIKPIESRMEEAHRSSAQDADARFWAYLDQHAPTWAALNEDAAFLTWLDEEDGLSGMKRIDLLQTAQGNLDGPRAARFFQTYAELHKAAPAAAPGAQQPNPLESQIQPGQGSGGDPSSQAQVGKVWTRAEIAQFERQAFQGSQHKEGPYAGKPDEVKRIRADIQRAVAEGRVR